MKHLIHHCHINPAFTDGGQCLIILAETAILAQPGKCSLHNPAFGQHHKVFEVAAPDNLGTYIEQDGTPVQQRRAIITAIQQQFFPAGIQRHALEQVPYTVTVRPVGRMNQHPHQPALAIDKDMPFASLHLFATIVATRPLFPSF